MNELETLEKEVKRILENIPETRDNDMILYYEYCLQNWVRPTEMYKVFSDSDFRKNKRVSVFESVSRARRKVRERNPELKATKVVQELREEKEEEFRNYFGR